MPSHVNVWCGIRSVSFQDSFCDRNQREPAARTICGSAPGVAERVGQPDVLRLDAELLQEEPLAGHHLPGHRLAAGHVGVGLDPHPADRHELPGRDLLADAVEQLGVELLHPGVLLGRRAREHEVRVGVHQREHVGERAGALAHGLAHRPQPGRVDVRVPDRVARGARWPTRVRRAAGAATCGRRAADPATSSGSTVSSSVLEPEPDARAPRRVRAAAPSSARSAPSGPAAAPTPRRRAGRRRRTAARTAARCPPWPARRTASGRTRSCWRCSGCRPPRRTRRSARPPAHGTAWFIGETPLIVVPSGRHDQPLGLEPGVRPGEPQVDHQLDRGARRRTTPSGHLHRSRGTRWCSTARPSETRRDRRELLADRLRGTAPARREPTTRSGRAGPRSR